MKLQNFLHAKPLKESVHLDIDRVSIFRDEVAEALDKFYEAIHAEGFNVDEYTEENGGDDFCVVFTNKIFDIVLEIKIKPGNRGIGSESFDLIVQLSINDTYAVGAGKTVPTEVDLWSWNAINTDDALVAKINAAAKQIKINAGALTEWYFDVSGKYGKIKMYTDTSHAYGGSGSSSKIVKAVAGSFHTGSLKAEVY